MTRHGPAIRARDTGDVHTERVDGVETRCTYGSLVNVKNMLSRYFDGQRIWQWRNATWSWSTASRHFSARCLNNDNPDEYWREVFPVNNKASSPAAPAATAALLDHGDGANAPQTRAVVGTGEQARAERFSLLDYSTGSPEEDDRALRFSLLELD